MAVTLSSQPGKVLLSRNPIKYAGSTDNYVSTEGVRSLHRFTLATNPGAGDTLEIDAPGLDAPIMYTCAASPDSSGTQFPEKSGSETFQEYYWRLIPFIRANATFNRYYTITIDAINQVIIQAREQGANWSMTVTHTGYTLGGVLTIPGIDPVLTENYYLRYRVVFDVAASTFIEGPWQYLIPEDDGDWELYIQDTVDDLLSDTAQNYTYVMAGAPAFIPPQLNGAVVMRVEFAEHYGADPFANPVKVADPVQVVRGGFRTIDQSQSLMTQFNTGKKFLTWRPDEIYTDWNVPDWLHFIFYQASPTATQLRLKVDVYNTDGTTYSNASLVTYSLAYTTFPYQNGSIFSVPAGYKQLLLDLLNFGKVPHYYELSITDQGGTVLVNKKRFYVVPSSKLIGSIQYINSFGMLESRYMEGERELIAEAEFETLQLPAPNTPQAYDLVDLDYNHLLTNRIDASTGVLSTDEAIALQDILVSPRVFWIGNLTSGTKYRVACRVVDSSLSPASKDVENSGNVRSASFSIEFNKERNHSNINKVW